MAVHKAAPLVIKEDGHVIRAHLRSSLNVSILHLRSDGSLCTNTGQDTPLHASVIPEIHLLVHSGDDN